VSIFQELLQFYWVLSGRTELGRDWLIGLVRRFDVAYFGFVLEPLLVGDEEFDARQGQIELCLVRRLVDEGGQLGHGALGPAQPDGVGVVVVVDVAAEEVERHGALQQRLGHRRRLLGRGADGRPRHRSVKRNEKNKTPISVEFSLRSSRPTLCCRLSFQNRSSLEFPVFLRF